MAQRRVMLFALMAVTIAASSSDRAAAADVRWDSDDPNCVGWLDGSGGKFLAFSRDGRKILTGGDPASTDQPGVPPTLHAFEEEVRVWDGTTFVPLSDPLLPGGNVVAAELSPDGRYVMAAGRELRFWTCEGGKPLRSIHVPGKIRFAALSPDGKRVLSASSDHYARLWQVDTGRQVMEIKHDGEVTYCAFSPDGRKFLTRLSGAISVFDADSGKSLFTFGPCSPDARRPAAFSPDGKLLALALNQQVGVRDLEHEGKELFTALAADFDDPHLLPVNSVSFSLDGTRLLSESFYVQVWNSRTGDEICPRITSPLLPAALSPNGKSVATAGDTPGIHLIDGGAVVQPLPPFAHVLAFSPNGCLVATGRRSSAVTVGHAAGETLIWKVKASLR